MLAGENVKGCKEGDVILLGCKPQLAEDILAEEGVKEALEGKMLVSICAGLRIEQLQKWVHPSTKVVRAMPNTPAKVSSKWHKALHEAKQ
jgi:pyrroline-5-carboxylate reductase